MFKKKKKISIIGDEWAVYTYGYGEGQRAAICFDVSQTKEEKLRAMIIVKESLYLYLLPQLRKTA